MSKNENLNIKEYSTEYLSLVGEKFSMLTIIEILPRERDKYGKLKPPRCICRCDCGKLSEKKIYDVINYNSLSCGCLRGKHGADKDTNTSASIIDSLAAIYYCKYPTTTCVRSSVHRLCCHECDRYKNCTQACGNTPEKCLAPIRDEMEKES